MYAKQKPMEYSPSGDDSRSCEQLEKRVTDKYFENKC